MKQNRPSLASIDLGARLARKDAPADKVAQVAPPLEGEADKPHHGGRVQVLVRMQASERKALRRIALEQDCTVQDLVENAIRDILRRHGVEPS